jgi:sulfite exporter TauE/SafE/plastocyanin domain-containing protein/copper chaperone CopZ
MNIKNIRIPLMNMTCTSCEQAVSKALMELPGVLKVRASYTDLSADVVYDEELCALPDLHSCLDQAGYYTKKEKPSWQGYVLLPGIAVLLVVLASFGILKPTRLFAGTYLALFATGLLTSVHCIAMCGGIMISQTIRSRPEEKGPHVSPALLYNLGRVVSYTLLGGIVGAVGSVFALSPVMKGALQIGAGLFLVLMGLSHLGFTSIRKFIPKLPGLKFRKRQGSSFLVGIMNGLMPCGALMTMQVFALGTGSAVSGALSMLFFSLGTVPLMLAFGFLSTFLTRKAGRNLQMASGALILFLGLSMGLRGFTLSGVDFGIGRFISGLDLPVISALFPKQAYETKATLKDGKQYIDFYATGQGYEPFVAYIVKDVPVELNIHGTDLDSCNERIYIPSLNQEIPLKEGDNIISFTPGDRDISFSCWMGMKSARIRVVDDLASVDALTTTNTSPYGADITKEPTDKLVRLAVPKDDLQEIIVKGTGKDLQPLILGVEAGREVSLTLDLSGFIFYDSTFSIMDTLKEGPPLHTFQGDKGTVVTAFTLPEEGTYALVAQGSLLAVIDAMPSLETASKEELRTKYLGE